MWLYILVSRLYTVAIRIAALFSSKARKAVLGRRNFFAGNLNPQGHSHIWFHCASLGEFEQGRPLLEKVKEKFPDQKILLSFFSPSGYESKKEYPHADVVVYLPFDSTFNARKFIGMFKIGKAIFVKYDLWPGYVNELVQQKIPTFLVSALFRKDQFYFKPYGSAFCNLLKKLDGIVVQNEDSLAIAESHGFSNVQVGGDMRIDRVLEVRKSSSRIPEAEGFLKGKKAVVFGSVYPEEIELIHAVCKGLSKEDKVILAPHHVDASTVSFFRKHLPSVVLYSQLDRLADEQVLILDHIGSLSRIYQYAERVYVGGGFGRSIHNILEPAVYGVPVYFGPAYSKFPEAGQFIKAGFGFSEHVPSALANCMLKDHEAHTPARDEKIYQACAGWFQNQPGATSLTFRAIFGKQEC